ncbi:hypothetical protein MRB53_035244 [Persea americana]|uniref:Uncharacterized protein n=1 Tax=Persea americana TaxID=3435 RepID=A0ACC2K4L2_PERAE|nr:hypothetical protein MRB53_035244 [Persea americana]
MQFLQTEKCRNMLLRPQSNVKELYKKLMVNLDNTEDTKPPQYYVCLNYVFKSRTNDEGNVNEGVLVKESTTYMITDDLEVFPVSTLTSWVVLNNLGITERTTLEERSVDLGEKEALAFLKVSFISETVLTDVFSRRSDDAKTMVSAFKCVKTEI